MYKKGVFVSSIWDEIKVLEILTLHLNNVAKN